MSSVSSYNLSLHPDHVRYILALLSELPYKQSHPIIENILAQTDVQDKAAATTLTNPAVPANLDKQVADLPPPPPATGG